MALAALSVPRLASADDDPGASLPGTVASGARALLRDGTDRIEGFVVSHLSMKSRRPDWLREVSPSGLDTGETAVGADALQLVVQQNRRDGTNLLTLRYPLGSRGALRTYAGAGLNRAEYYATPADTAPAALSRQNRHHSVGAAAEFGAELRLSGRLRVNADVHWIEFDQQASLLRTDYGLAAADPLSLGVSLGWRFR